MNKHRKGYSYLFPLSGDGLNQAMMGCTKAKSMHNAPTMGCADCSIKKSELYGKNPTLTRMTTKATVVMRTAEVMVTWCSRNHKSFPAGLTSLHVSL